MLLSGDSNPARHPQQASNGSILRSEAL